MPIHQKNLAVVVVSGLYILERRRIRALAAHPEGLHSHIERIGLRVVALGKEGLREGRVAEEDFGRGAGCDGAAHAHGEVGEADLVGGYSDSESVGGRQEGRRRKGMGWARTVHPSKPFARDHLEVDALVAVLGVDQVRELDCIELLRNDAVEVDKCSRHPVMAATDQTTCMQGSNRSLHVEPSVRQTLGILEVPVPFEPDPCHDLMRRPVVHAA